MCFGGGGAGQQSMVKDQIFIFFCDPSLSIILYNMIKKELL